MSIKVILEAPGLKLSANVKDSALSELIRLVHEARDDSVPAPPNIIESPRISVASNSPERTSVGAPAEDTKKHLKAFGAGELLNHLKKWDSFPEKIVLLGAWKEGHNDGSPWRSADMDEAFRQAKESAPSNFPRDIRIAIKQGWIHSVTPRTYTVTRTGWNNIRSALEEASNEPEAT